MHKTRLSPSGWLALILLAFWAVVPGGLVKTATAAPVDPVLWGRSAQTSVQGDTLAVPARWNPSCDALGCADAYRVTWAIAVTTENADGVQTVNQVVRDTTITRAVDTARVPMPPIARPATVCLYVVAVRRGLASTATSACRTIEAPDAPPPAVDSIYFDSIGVRPLEALRDSVDATALRLSMSAYQWHDTIDASGALRRDSALVRYTADSVRMSMNPGWTTQFCAIAPHKYAPTPVVVLPEGPFTRHQVEQLITLCGEAARLDYTGTPRFARDQLAFSTEDAGG